MFSRFAHVSENIFEFLDNKSLANCRLVRKSWRTYLDHQKFFQIRMIQSWIEKKHEMREPWKKLLEKSNSEIILELCCAVKEIYALPWPGNVKILTPIFVAAYVGNVKLYKV